MGILKQTKDIYALSSNLDLSLNSLTKIVIKSKLDLIIRKAKTLNKICGKESSASWLLDKDIEYAICGAERIVWFKKELVTELNEPFISDETILPLFLMVCDFQNLDYKILGKEFKSYNCIIQYFRPVVDCEFDCLDFTDKNNKIRLKMFDTIISDPTIISALGELKKDNYLKFVQNYSKLSKEEVVKRYLSIHYPNVDTIEETKIND